MRFRSLFLLLAVALTCAVAAAAGPPPERQSSGASGDADLQRLTEFLAWAHPQDDCGPPSGIRIIDRWAGGLTARYEFVCAGATRALQGVFQTREKEGVWQVSAGFEAEADRIRSALETLNEASRPAPPPPGGLEPPPANTGSRPPASPLGLVPPPKPSGEIVPEYPEEAGRARPIGDAHVGLLVEVSPEGGPLRARPLRGPDPDLGMRRAATDAVMRSRFQPARLEGRPVTYFAPVEMTFAGLPPESRDWVHGALFHVEAIVSSDGAAVDEALRRLQAGETFEAIAGGPWSGGSAAGPAEPPVRGGDWGFVSAATLPAAVRKALHEARIGGHAGPVSAEGLHYLLLKLGEVYYALRLRDDGGELSYQILYERNAPEGDALRRAVESDIADYLAESRRQSYVNEAARLMGIRQVEMQVGQLQIRTDVLDDAEIRMLGQVVEAAMRAHEEFWAPLVPLRPFRQQILVYAWAHQTDHDRLHGLWQAVRKPATQARPPAAPPD